LADASFTGSKGQSKSGAATFGSMVRSGASHRWEVHPSGTLGYNKAEVTLGGVDTRGLSSRTMEAVKVPGLYFIGAAVDVTGHLGGFNFQWAWASGHAAGAAA
jgi:predicted flavoprotein YhiN